MTASTTKGNFIHPMQEEISRLFGGSTIIGGSFRHEPKVAETITDVAELKRQANIAITRARAGNDGVMVGISVPQAIADDLRAWAERRGWQEQRESMTGKVAWIAPADGNQQRTWRRWDTVSCLMATAVHVGAEPLLTIATPGRPTLRDYQLKAIDDIEAHWDSGIRNVLLQSVTGSGKSVMIAETARRHVERGGLVVAIAHTRELIEQLHEKLVHGGLPLQDVGISMQGYKPAGGQRIVVTTIQSARKLKDHFGPLANNMLVIIDEAHHSTAKSYQNALKMLAPQRVLGATATPMRTDGSGLGDTYEVMVQALTYREGFERGFLVKPKYYVPTEPDLAALKTTGGDYDAEESNTLMTQPEIVGSVVEHIHKLAADRQIIVFCVTRAHSRALQEKVAASGLTAEHVDGETPKPERDAIFTRFRSGETQVLLNVGIATEGVDVPAVGAVVIARPTKSPIIWIQMAGRALRPAEGKSDCLVIDHSGSWHNLGPVEEYEDWTLEKGKAKNKVTKAKEGKSMVERECECGHIWTAAPSAKCPACGAVRAGKRWAAENQASLDADLVEAESKMDPKLKQSRLKASMTPEQLREMYQMMRQYARSSTRSGNEKQAYHWFEEMFGNFPTNKWRWDPLRPVTPEAAAMISAHVRAKSAAWHIQKQKAEEARKRDQENLAALMAAGI